jgi:hypothetical protein
LLCLNNSVIFTLTPINQVANEYLCLRELSFAWDVIRYD